MTTQLHTHSYAGLPNLVSHGGLAGQHSHLCFDPRSFSKASNPAEQGPFDAHAFVSKTLSATNPAFQAQQQPPADEVERIMGADGSYVLPAPTASPQVPLELLREHLTSYQLYIKNELIELLNNEYQDFIGLSSSLTGIDTKIAAMETSLKGLVNELTRLQSKLSSDGMQPFDAKFVQQYLREKNKQTYLHAIMRILEQMKQSDVQLKANEEEEVQFLASQSKDEKHVVETSASDRIVQHHLAMAQTRHQDRVQAEKKQSRLGASTTGSNASTNRYEGLKLDIPLWMLHSASGTRPPHQRDTRSYDHDSVDGDEEDWEEEDFNDAGDAEAEALRCQAAELDLNSNDAFGLYQALLNAPAATAAAAVAPSPASSASSSEITSLRNNLYRVERVAHSILSLENLIDLCQHFHLVRDLKDQKNAATVASNANTAGKVQQKDKAAAAVVVAPFDQLKAKLHNQLQSYFIRVLELLAAFDPSASSSAVSKADLQGLLRTSLRIFHFLDHATQAEDLVREHLVLPVLKRVVTVDPAMRHTHSLDENAYWASRGDKSHVFQEPLNKIYDELLKFLRGNFTLLLQACQSNFPLFPTSASPTSTTPSSTLTFSFLSNSFFVELVNFLSRPELQSFIFTSGLPHLFLQHYRITKSFLQSLEQLASEIDGNGASKSGLLQSLHAHPSWATFSKKWNVSIYFQLRFHAIAAKLEQAIIGATKETSVAGATGATKDATIMSCVNELLQQSTAVEPCPSAAGSSAPSLTSLESYASCFYLSFTRTCWSSLLSCFHKHIFLDDIAQRFIKLSLQLIQRLQKFAQELLERYSVASLTENPLTPNAASGAFWLLTLLYSDLSHLTHTLIPHFYLPFVLEKCGACSQATSQLLKSFVVRPLSDDKQQQKQRKAELLASGKEEDEVGLLIISSYSSVLSASATLLTQLNSRLVEWLYQSSRESLQCVPRISSAYRGTRRKLPAHAFKYITFLFTHLARFSAAVEGGAAEVRKCIAQEMKENAEGAAEMRASEWMADETNEEAISHLLSSASKSSSSAALFAAQIRGEILASVVTKLTSEFESKAKDCLNDVARFEELSKKLGKKPTTTGAAADVNDSDKTRKQLELDVHYYSRIIQQQLRVPQAEQIMQSLVNMNKV